MSHPSDELPPELRELGERLRDERPAMDALAFDRGQQRVRRASGQTRRRSRRGSLAVALCLSIGAVLSSGGAGLAVSGLSSTGSTAVQAQYPTTPTTATTPPATTTTPTSAYTATTGTTTTVTPTTPVVAGTTTTGTTPTIGTVTATTPAVAGVSTSGTTPTRPAEQVGATQGASTLPFTGFAAVPVMLAGLALMIGGLALRRRRASDV